MNNLPFALKKALVLIFISLLTLGATITFGQSPKQDSSADTPAFWIYGGPNLSTLGPGLTTGFSARNGNHLFSLRTISSDPLTYLDTWEAAVLYGRTMAVHDFLFTAGTGVAVVGGRRYPRLIATGAGEELEPMIGFPLEGQLIWNPFKYAGLGIYGFANVNTGQPFGGITLNIRIGSGW